MPEPMSPVSVETAIRQCANRIAAGVRVCSDTYKAYLDSERAYQRAYAQAYLAADGPAHERRYAAEIATGEERYLRDECDVKYRYADRTAKAIEAELRALQSVGASVRQAYSVAGRGEGA